MSNNDAAIEHLVGLFRLLADPARLRILGALAERPLTGRALSERLGLTPPTISHHMARLVAGGLVSATPSGTSRRYALQPQVLREMSRSAAPPRAPSSDGSASPTEAEVVRDFFVDGRLLRIPARRKKRVLVLRHLMRLFSPDHELTEQEVNDRLREAHEDVATLRRELIEYGFMTRECGRYRVARSLPPRGPTVAQEIPADEEDWLRSLLSFARSGPCARASGA